MCPSSLLNVLASMCCTACLNVLVAAPTCWSPLGRCSMCWSLLNVLVAAPTCPSLLASMCWSPLGRCSMCWSLLNVLVAAPTCPSLLASMCWSLLNVLVAAQCAGHCSTCGSLLQRAGRCLPQCARHSLCSRIVSKSMCGRGQSGGVAGH